MNPLLKAALKKISDEEVDQWALWKFETQYGTVYVQMMRELPKDHTDEMYEEI